MKVNFILLHERMLERRGGSLLSRTTQQQQIPALEGSLWWADLLDPKQPSRTFHSHEFEGDTLPDCPMSHVQRLSDHQFSLLSAVESCEERLKLFRDKNWFSDIEKIQVGSIVYVINVIEVPEKTPAKVKYIGELPSQCGTWFGVVLSRVSKSIYFFFSFLCTVFELSAS